MEREPMIRLKNLSKYYQGKENVVKALDSINIEFNLGEFVVITGESGSGKSTFLNVISGLDTYEDGELYINGEETAHYSPEEWENYRRNNISFIFQNYNIVDAYTVYQNVDAKPQTDPTNIKANLNAQLIAPVRWTETIQNMIANGADHFVEIGPGKVLQGLIKKIDRKVQTEGISQL